MLGGVDVVQLGAGQQVAGLAEQADRVLGDRRGAERVEQAGGDLASDSAVRAE